MWAGLGIGIGVYLMMRHADIHSQLWITSNRIKADLILFAALTIIHGMIGGGVEGVLHAAIASGVLTLYIDSLRKRIGFKDSMGYHPGTENHDNEL